MDVELERLLDVEDGKKVLQLSRVDRASSTFLSRLGTGTRL